jgi:hypothetical protein
MMNLELIILIIEKNKKLSKKNYTLKIGIGKIFPLFRVVFRVDPRHGLGPIFFWSGPVRSDSTPGPVRFRSGFYHIKNFRQTFYEIKFFNLFYIFV